MGIESLMRDAVTITELLAEDAQGVAGERTTTLHGAYLQPSYRTLRTPSGATPSATWLVVLPCDGFGVAWSAKGGDRVSVRGRSLVVGSAKPVISPRSLVPHHAEITG